MYIVQLNKKSYYFPNYSLTTNVNDAILNCYLSLEEAEKVAAHYGGKVLQVVCEEVGKQKVKSVEKKGKKK